MNDVETWIAKVCTQDPANWLSRSRHAGNMLSYIETHRSYAVMDVTSINRVTTLCYDAICIVMRMTSARVFISLRGYAELLAK